MRKLVTIQKIKEIREIPNADRLVSADILGWKCVIPKNQFNIGDLCIYFEIDSFLPEHEFYKNSSTFEFLVKTSYKPTDWQGNGYRIRTQKIRGEISQGLVLPLSILNEVGNTFTDRNVTIEIEEDITDIFGVVKFNPPEYQTGVGTVKGMIGHGIYTTDETRIQTAPNIIKELTGKPYYITSKMDGTSVTMYTKNGSFGITGHEKEFILDENCMFYLYSQKYNIEERIKGLSRNLAFQGEFCGPGIQENRLGLKKSKWYVFNIQDLNILDFLSFNEMKYICMQLGIEMVPIVEEGYSFHYTVEELLQLADGVYPTGKRREGIVIRPQVETYSAVLNKRLSFKVINNNYLLKNGL